MQIFDKPYTCVVSCSSFSPPYMCVQEVQNPDDAMPPVVEFLPRGLSEYYFERLFVSCFVSEKDDVSDDDDDDILIGGVMQDFKCPITLTFLVDPLTS